MKQEAVNQYMDRISGRAVTAGAVAAVVMVIGLFLDSSAFFESYLIAYLFWISLSLGCLAILMVHHLVGGGWGFVIRRMLEAGARTLPVMAVLFIPVIMGMSDIFEWTDEDVVAGNYILQEKVKYYLNEPFFIMRSAIYFVIWIGLAWLLTGWSYRQDENGNLMLNRSMRIFSGLGMVLYVLASTFAAFDWIMSLDPIWFSSIYGPIFIVAHFLTAFAMMSALIAWMSRYEPLSGVVREKHFHDLGNLLFASLVLWAYVAFSQFIIIWSGNLPDTISWYLDRSANGWPMVTILLALFHFVIPFFILLSRFSKQKARVLMAIAAGILLFRFLDLFWLIIPTIHDGAFAIHWLYFVTPVAMGGIWFLFFTRMVKSKSILPLHDARFEGLLSGKEAAIHE